MWSNENMYMEIQEYAKWKKTPPGNETAMKRYYSKQLKYIYVKHIK